MCVNDNIAFTRIPFRSNCSKHRLICEWIASSGFFSHRSSLVDRRYFGAQIVREIFKPFDPDRSRKRGACSLMTMGSVPTINKRRFTRPHKRPSKLPEMAREIGRPVLHIRNAGRLLTLSFQVIYAIHGRNNIDDK